MAQVLMPCLAESSLHEVVAHANSYLLVYAV